MEGSAGSAAGRLRAAGRVAIGRKPQSEDLLLEIRRHGFLEETHWTVAYSPVPDETAPNDIGGLLARCTRSPLRSSGSAVVRCASSPVDLAEQRLPRKRARPPLRPLRAIDRTFPSRFIDLATTQLATAIANARAYDEERRRAESLAELDRAKTAFFSNVSVEFRTPLTLTLRPVEEGLQDANEPLPPGQWQRQETVHRNAVRLLKLVNSLLRQGVSALLRGTDKGGPPGPHQASILLVPVGGAPSAAAKRL